MALQRAEVGSYGPLAKKISQRERREAATAYNANYLKKKKKFSVKLISSVILDVCGRIKECLKNTD